MFVNCMAVIETFSFLALTYSEFYNSHLLKSLNSFLLYHQQVLSFAQSKIFTPVDVRRNFSRGETSTICLSFSTF